MMEELLALRADLDGVNLRLLELLAERGRLVQQVAEVKSRLGLPLYDPRREEEELARLVQVNPGPYPAEAIRAIWGEVLRASRHLLEEESPPLLVRRRPGVPDTVIRVGGVAIGGKEPVVIAGPCAVEGREQIAEVAAGLSRLGVRLLRGSAFKPRTSPYNFQGLGEEGLVWLAEAARRHGMAVVTEVIDPRDVEMVGRYADILQVGSRNMHNFALLRAVGAAGRPVLLKRGFMATVEELLYAAEYVLAGGNGQVVLCERGIRTFERWTRNTLDISAVALLKQESPLPVIVDISHAAGRKDIALPLARAALAAGADGLMVEVHPWPSLARSDAAQQLDLEEFARLLESLEYSPALP